MGKKFPIDTAFRPMRDQNTIFNDNNPYGYQINVNHPQIRPYYEQFKKKYSIRIPSDAQRKAFEDAILRMINRKD